MSQNTDQNSNSPIQRTSLSREFDQIIQNPTGKRKRDTPNVLDQDFVELASDNEEETLEPPLEFSDFEEIQSLNESQVSDVSSESSNSSFVLQYFERIDDEKVQCLICKAQGKGKEGLKYPKVGGKITNLHKHPCILKLKKEKNDGKDKIQTTLTGKPLYGPKLPPIEQKKITNYLKKWILLDEQAFFVTKSDSFRQFVWNLNNRYRIPKTTTVKDLLNDDLIKLESFLTNTLIPSLSSFSLSFDLCTTQTDLHLLCVVMHWFNIDKKSLDAKILKIIDMSDVVHVTGEKIKDSLENMMNHFKFDKEKVLMWVADGGSNGKNAIEEQLGADLFHCLPHVLNLIVQSALQIIGSLLHKCKSIVTFIHQSNVAWTILKQKQAQENDLLQLSNIIYKIVMEVSTRWNSSLMMMKRLELLTKCLNETFKELNRNDFIISKEDHSILKDIISILEPIERESTYFSSEKHSRLSHVWPRMIALEQDLLESDLQHEISFQFRDFIVKDLKERCNKIFKMEIIQFGTILDPIFKDLSFIENENEKKSYYTTFIDKCVKNYMKITPLQTITSSISQSTPSNAPKQTGNLSKFMNVTKTVSQSILSESELKKKYKNDTSDELKEFLKIQNTEDIITIDPLDWWHMNRLRFPILSKMAFVFLSIPTGSVAVERRFSTINRIVQGRWKLEAKTIEILTTLKDWIEDTNYKQIFK